MSEAEKEVLKTLKSGVGLTSAEQEILVNYIDKLQKELEEKTIILMVGADKVKQLEKENEELKSKKQLEIDTSEEVLKWKGKYHLLSRENTELKEKIKEYEIGMLKE